MTVGAKTTATDVTYQVEKGAAVRIDGQEAGLADLKPGTPATLLLSPANDGVVGVRVGKAKVK